MKTATKLSAIVMTATILLFSAAGNASDSLTTSRNQPAPVAIESQNMGTGIQLADEIIRRIRRLGVNVIRFPNMRPNETVGEIC